MVSGNRKQVTLSEIERFQKLAVDREARVKDSSFHVPCFVGKFHLGELGKMIQMILQTRL